MANSENANPPAEDNEPIFGPDDPWMRMYAHIKDQFAQIHAEGGREIANRLFDEWDRSNMKDWFHYEQLVRLSQMLVRTAPDVRNSFVKALLKLHAADEELRALGTHDLTEFAWDMWSPDTRDAIVAALKKLERVD